jgi:hypothetical protein
MPARTRAPDASMLSEPVSRPHGKWIPAITVSVIEPSLKA